MQWRTIMAEQWPGLAWAARAPHDQPAKALMDVIHGRDVEVGEDRLTEGVWPGDFRKGDFDRTGEMFGTGIRIRADHVAFVSSSTVVERLWYSQSSDASYVSNSLPALLAVAGVGLRDDEDYRPLMRSVLRGLEGCEREIPTEAGPVRVLYHYNLIYDGSQWREEPKPRRAPDFHSFEDYKTFMWKTSRALGDNARSPDRRQPIQLLTTLSRGYDSPVAALAAREAGCTQAVTIRRARGLKTGSDSGASIAQTLGFTCRSYPRTKPRMEHEAAWWAALGDFEDVNLAVFSTPRPLCLLYTGFNGDKIWDRKRIPGVEKMIRGDTSGTALAEARLFEGVFHCPVPFWGIRKGEQIQAISRSEEMAPWSVGGEYDRPICRRLVEEAGVPRSAFGQHKRATSYSDRVAFPFSRRARADFSHYLTEHGVAVPSLRLMELVNNVDLRVLNRVRRLVGRRKRRELRVAKEAHMLLFQWANTHLKTYYAHGLPRLSD